MTVQVLRFKSKYRELLRAAFRSFINRLLLHVYMLCVYICVCTCVCVCTYVCVRVCLYAQAHEQVGACPSCHLCGGEKITLRSRFQGLISSCQAQPQAPLLAGPAWCPEEFYSNTIQNATISAEQTEFSSRLQRRMEPPAGGCLSACSFTDVTDKMGFNPSCSLPSCAR